jgi:DNA-binding NarL/FixJ family response regulator
MKVENSHFRAVPSPSGLTNAVDKLSRLQTEVVAEALRRAVDDASAAMAHQLGEPLTALLFVLHEIKQAGERSDGAETVPVSVREHVAMALREVERVCDIIERVAKPGETMTDAEAAVARGREAIDMWARDSRARARGAASPADPLVNLHALTPREQEVLALIVEGSSNKEGGHRLGISTRTFEAHRAHLMGKLGARNAADLIRKTSSRHT